jgi:hypothetical protein
MIYNCEMDKAERKAEKKLVNFRADLVVCGYIDELMNRWERSQTDVIIRALRESFERGEVEADTRLDEVLELLHSLPQTFQEAMDEYKGRQKGETSRLPAIPAGLPPIEVSQFESEKFPFHPKCAHCGENFGAWNRNATICIDCKAARHGGDPRDCVQCANNSATGAL